jgi:hypothetical protein
MECSDQKTYDLYNPRKLPPEAFVSRIELLGRHLEIDTRVFRIWAIQNKTPLIMLYDYDVKSQRSIEVAARLEEEAAIENGRSPGTPWTIQDTVRALLMRVRNEQTPQREREYDLRTLSIGRHHPTGHFVGLLCENDAFAFRLGVL